MSYSTRLEGVRLAVAALHDAQKAEARTLARRLDEIDARASLLLDEDRLLHLLIEVAPDTRPRKLPVGRGFLIEEREHPDVAGNTRPHIDVTCRSGQLLSVFELLIDEALELLIDEAKPGWTAVVLAVERFRKLFGRGPLRRLSEDRLIGLIGELLTLQELLDSGMSGVAPWTGPSGATRDFVAPACELEVKTGIASDELVVHVSSLQQLDAATDETLYIQVWLLDRDDDGDISLPALVDQLLLHPTVDESEFRKLLALAGYDEHYREDYGGLRFSRQECRVHLVDDEFPRLTAASFVVGSPPDEVGTVSYELNLTAIDGGRADESARKGIYQVFLGHRSCN